MYNAMRNSKRALAGFAAVALGAGALTFVGAGPASAANATTLTLDNAGLSVVADTDLADGFLVNAVAADALGNAPTTLTTGTNTQVGTATVTTWPDAPVGSSDIEVTGLSVGGNLIFDANGLASFVIEGSAGNWDVTPGTYNVRVSLTNTINGSSIVKDFPVRVFEQGTAPSASIQWVQSIENPYAPVNALSTLAGADVEAGPYGYARLFAGANALLVDPAMSTTGGAVNILAASTTRAYGLTPSGSSTAAAVETTIVGLGGPTNGVYEVFADQAPSTGFWTAGTQNFSLEYFQTATPAATSRLPIIIGSAAGTNSASQLVTEPNLEISPGVYQVPAGTTALSFVSTTDDTTGTVPWTAATDAAGGSITASAGVSAISAASIGNVYRTSVTLNAPAAAASKSMTYTSGVGGSVTVTQALPVPAIDAPASLIAKVGDSVTITGAVADQWGRPLSAAAVVSLFAPDATLLGSVVPGADGAFSFTVPAALAPKTPDAIDFDLQATVGGNAPTNATVTVDYTATGTITSLVISTQPVSVSGQIPAIQVPASGSLNLANVSATLLNPAAPGSTVPPGQVVYMTFDSDPSTAITVTGSEGVYFSTANTGVVNWNGGKKSVVVNDLDQLTVWATKTGKSTITATAGGKTATQDIFAFTPPTAARNVKLTPEKMDIATNSFKPVELQVTDVFGNPVPGVTVGTAATNQVAIGLAGGGSLPTTFSTTGVDGKSVFSYTSGAAVGDAEVIAAGSPGASVATQFFADILDAPAAVRTAKSVIAVGGAGSKSITIVGSRTTVSGKPGIVVDGVVTGIENGKTVKPFFRFPGQTTFTEGSARPVIEAGSFTWQRKTGKKFYAYVTSDDGAVQSNRVIIPAN